MRLRLCLALLCPLLAGTATAQNLVPDPAFRASIASWTGLGISGSFSMSFDPVMTRRPGTGSGKLVLDSPGAGTFAACFPVTEGRTYERGFSIFYPDPTRITGLSEALGFYGSTTCSGAQLGGSLLTISGLPTGVWVDFAPVLITAPVGARSALYGFGGLALGGNAATAFVDDVFFAPPGTVPPIEPLKDVPAVSAIGLLLAGAGLALAGTRFLRA